MELLKRTVKAGNSSAVVLPKAWLDKRVRVELIEKTPETMLYDVLEKVKAVISFSEIIGIYLVGSYARGEEDENSDTDILIISEKTSKEIIKRGNYEIMIVSMDLLNYKLKEDLLPIGTMLKEAKPLLNSSLLKEIKIEVTKKNVKWYLKTTEDHLKIIKDSINRIEKYKPEGKLSDAVAYSLILRLRTLYMIERLKNNKECNKNEFIKLTKEISGSLIAYNRYVYAKSNGENKRELPLCEGKRLYEHLKEYLQRIKKSLR